jgi:hypothetical protein
VRGSGGMNAMQCNKRRGYKNERIGAPDAGQQKRERRGSGPTGVVRSLDAGPGSLFNGAILARYQNTLSRPRLSIVKKKKRKRVFLE